MNRFFPGLFLTTILLAQGPTWGTSLAVAQEPEPIQGSTRGDAWPIELLTRTFTPAPGIDPALRSRALSQAGGQIHVLLQMDHIPTPEERAALAAQHIELQEYVPQRAWIALVPAAGVAALAARPGIRWVGPWDVTDKLSPRVQTGDFAGWAVHESGRVQVMVLLHADVSLAEGETLAATHGGIVAGSISTPRALTVWIMPENLPALAAEEGVLWIEEGTPPLTPTNDDARRTLGVDTLHAAPYGLDGSGVKLFVFDGGRVDSHAALSGRLTYVDSAPFDNTYHHPTHVAGTAAGDGTDSPSGRNLKGMAPAASIYSAGYQQTGGTMLFWDNAGDIEADYATARNTYDVDLATNSIGSNTAGNGYDCDREGDYGVSSSMIDGIVRGDNIAVGTPYIVIWANGNERTGTNGTDYGRCGSNYHTTAPPSCAKNPIHVGATNSDGDSMTSFSSWGPCDDGRLKPTVSGPGCESGRASGEGYIYSTLTGSTYGGMCGTSMATPAVAGVASLAIEQYRNSTGNPAARPSNALMKAWLIHTARDLGNDGPDYVYGYGEVDAVAVVDLITSTANYTNSIISASGVTDTYTYHVPEDASEFKVSLAWDDYAATAFAVNALVNDLDLQVQAPGGTIIYPFSLDPSNPENLATATGPNTRDNQEQVVVQNPAAGVWMVRVRGTSVPQAPQSYALAYSHELGIPDCSQVVVNGDFESVTGNWTLSGADRVSSPGSPPFGGAWSLRLGGGVSTQHTAYQAVTIPADIDLSANLSLAWTMTTNEGGTLGHGWDKFYMEVRDTSDSPLAVYEMRNDGWPQNTWLTGDNIDLMPFAGQTVRITFYATNDNALSTTFYVDNVELEICKNKTAPNLEIGKTASPSPVQANRPLTYTLWVTNSGTAAATDLIITDTTPVSTTWASGGTLVGDVVSFTMSSLNTGESVSRTIVVTMDDVISGTIIYNDDYRVSSAQGISQTGSLVETIVHTPLPKLEITKAVSPSLALPNRPLTYTLWVTNSGTAAATDVLITDTVPVSATWASGGTLVMGVARFAVSSLYAGESISRTFTIVVENVISGTIIRNDDYRVSCAKGFTQSGSPVDTVVHVPLPMVQVHAHRVDDASGDNDGYLDPGERDVNLYVTLTNDGDATATNITAVLTPTTPGVTVSVNQAAYPDIDPGDTQENLTSYVISLSGSLDHSTGFDFEAQINTDQEVFTDTFSLPAEPYGVFLPLILRDD